MRTGQPIWLQCQESVELIAYWGHWGNKGSWLKATVVLLQLTQTINLIKKQQEVCSSYWESIYAHVVPGVHPRQFLLPEIKIYVTCSSHARFRLPLERLTPSVRGDGSWKQPRQPRRVNGGRRPGPKWKVQVWKQSAWTVAVWFLSLFSSRQPRQMRINIPSGNIFEHL